MPAIDLSELIEISQDDHQPSALRTINRSSKVYQYFFDEDISEPKKYRDLINLLYTANEEDEFNFFFNTPGGYLSTTMAIIEAIKGTDAIVRGIINGECHSGGSMLALSCHEIYVTEAAHMMIHTANMGTGGITANVQKHADFSTKHINRILDTIYSGFLTGEEIVSIKLGVEIWLDDQEIAARLQKRADYLKKKAVAEEKKEKAKVAVKKVPKKAPEPE